MILFLVAVTLAAAAGVGDHLSISVTNKYGDVFTNLTVAQILGDGLVLEHPAGAIKVKYKDLPQAVRDKYQPLAAAAVAKEREEGALNEAYVSHEEQLQDRQTQQLSVQKTQENEQANARRSGGNLQYFIVPIPNAGWRLTFINPGLKALVRQVRGDQVILRGLPGPNGANLAVFVEKPANDSMSNKAVFDYYWSKVAGDPLIDAHSVKVENEQKFVKVFYTLKGEPNVDYFFAFKDRWADVHLSKWPFRKTDSELFANFEEHLSYGE